MVLEFNEESLMKNLEFRSAIVQKKRLLSGIHGLRGLAAFAVVLYHLVHIGGIQTPAIFDFIKRDFGYSVHLFFILSAFSLMYSTEAKVNQPNWLTDYFIKRFFRIAPLFYFAIVYFIVFGLADKNFINIILNLTFTFGFNPPSGFVWGGVVSGSRNDFLCNISCVAFVN